MTTVEHVSFRQRFISLAALCGMVACGPAENEPVEVIASSHAVINNFNIEGASIEGITSGFNLDGLVSDDHDGRGCYQEDFVNQKGETGIDNALAKLLPLIDIAGEGALQGLLQQAVNEGRLLLVFKMEERTDGAYNIELLRGDDVPMLGTDGLLLSGQTLSLHSDSELGSFEGANNEGNVILAGPMKMHLPVVVFNILYELDLENAWIEFEVTEDGMMKNGRLGGSVTLEQVMSLAKVASMRTHGLEDLLAGGIQDAADLDRQADGKCGSLSMAVTFGGLPAFIF